MKTKDLRCYNKLINRSPVSIKINYLIPVADNGFRFFVIIIFLLIISGKSLAQVYGDFPYFQSFTSGVQPVEVSLLTPQAGTANATTFLPNGVQLTPASNNSFGAFYLNNQQFSSVNGIHIEFEYGMYGGTGADGISMFLFDASINNPVIGSYGGALGYAYNRTNNFSYFPTLRQTGLTGAYLGVGLDAFGNYKRNVFQGDMRSNGILPSTFNQYSSHVTLRGAKGTPVNASTGLGDGFTGYPVLITQSTLSGSIGAATINPVNGNYSTTAGLLNNFDLKTTTLGLTPADSNYRKVYIDLLPNPSGGFNVTVIIQHGSAITKVIENYWYETSYTYLENANSQISDYNTSDIQGANTSHTIITSVPTSFRVGFGASTGGLNNIHLIRNLMITLPFAAVAFDDMANYCIGSPCSINPLSNDVAYTGPVFGAPAESTSNIDLNSFRFIDTDGANQGQMYVADGIGTWSYSSVTGMVTFTPTEGYISEATVAYSIKGSTTPFNDEAYRSLPATITVNPLPKPTVTVSSDVSICNGNSTILSADGAVDYYWSPSTGLNADTGSTVTASSEITTIYTVTGSNSNGCSDTATVTVTNISLSEPILSSVTQPTCSDSTGSFNIINYDASFTYTITPSAGVSIAGNTITALAGTYQITAILGTCSSNASSTITVNKQPPVPVATITPAGPFCTDFSPVQLTGVPAGGSFSGKGINISGLFSPADAGAGNHSISYTYTNQYGCSVSDTIVILLSPGIIVDAGPDQTRPLGSIAVLIGIVTGGSGNYGYDWSPNNQLLNSNLYNPSTVPLTSDVLFLLNVLDLTSGCAGRDTVLIRLNDIIEPPVAVTDYDTTFVNTPVRINVLVNDTIRISTNTVSICSFPLQGTVISSSVSTFTYTPQPDYFGNDEFCYTLCDSNDPPQCDTARVLINIRKPDSGVVDPTSGVTANGDGINDVWVIRNIENYPDNDVVILNRWGDVIRRYEGYNNTSVTWDATNYSGKHVPDGTYYYILKIKEGANLSGWIFVRNGDF